MMTPKEARAAADETLAEMRRRVEEEAAKEKELAAAREERRLKNLAHRLDCELTSAMVQERSRVFIQFANSKTVLTALEMLDAAGWDAAVADSKECIIEVCGLWEAGK